MKVIKATQQMLETRTLVLGFQGENLRTQLRIDCSATFAEYPNATPALAIKPPTGETYPVFVDRDGTEVVWDIVANNLILKGDGELQLTFYKDNVIAKTSVGHITVNRSLQIDGEMPDVVATWIENANRKLAEVDAQIVELEGMVDTATDAATRAEQSASTASTKAEQAAGSAATATEKATEATNAAGTATAKAAEAQTAAQTATAKATSAAESERIATAKAVEATTAAETATAKAEQATEAAETATEKAGDASASATAAHASEINAAESADGAFSAEVGANAAKRAAETSATQAGISEQNAGIAAQTATQKAAEATQSATNAAIFAGTATTKAEEAAESAQAASDAQTAVEQTAEQLADSLEQISQNTADIAEHEQEYNALKESTLIHNTASGSIASFSDGAEMPVDEVTAQINPVQDLHGYDNPWPGGGGENILDPNITFDTTPLYGLTMSTTDGYHYSFSGTATSSGNIRTNRILKADAIILPAGTYISRSGTLALYYADGTWYRNQYSNVVFTVDAPFYVQMIYWEIVEGRSYDISNFIALSNGSTAPTEWTPYANICPISGFDSVNVWDDPKYGGTIKWNQLLSENQAVGSYSKFGLTFTMISGKMGFKVTGTFNFESGDRNAYIYRQNYPIAIIKDHVYCIAYDSKYATVYCYGAQFSGNWTGYAPHGGSIIKATNSANLNISLNFGPNISNGTVFNEKILINLFDLTEMFGEEKADEIYALDMQSPRGQGVTWFKALFPNNYYEPDNSYTETCVSAVNGDPYRHVEVEFPSEAGTVYGGELTVNADGSGSLVVDREIKSVREYAWYEFSDSGYAGLRTRDTDLIVDPGSLMCSHFMPSRVSVLSPGIIIAGGWYYNLAICLPDEFTTQTKLYAYSDAQEQAGTPLQISKKIASPRTYTLTAPEITTLLGENHLWHDANGDISVGYKANTKLYIDGKIAELVARIVNS